MNSSGESKRYLTLLNNFETYPYMSKNIKSCLVLYKFILHLPARNPQQLLPGTDASKKTLKRRIN